LDLCHCDDELMCCMIVEGYWNTTARLLSSLISIV
jgi:hypothetical protein